MFELNIKIDLIVVNNQHLIVNEYQLDQVIVDIIIVIYSLKYIIYLIKTNN